MRYAKTTLIILSCFAVSSCAPIEKLSKDLPDMTIATETLCKLGPDACKSAEKAMRIYITVKIAQEIAKHLNEQEKARMRKETGKLAASGGSKKWENPDTGIKKELKVKNKNTETKMAKVKVLKDRVSEVPPMDMTISGVYTVGNRNNVRVRGGPGTDYEIIGELPANSSIDVFGKVENKPWYLIGADGVAKGFVYATLLTSTGEPIAMGETTASNEGVSDEVEVEATLNCSTIEQKVILQNGEEVADEVTVCQQPDGSWA